MTEKSNVIEMPERAVVEKAREDAKTRLDERMAQKRREASEAPDQVPHTQDIDETEKALMEKYGSESWGVFASCFTALANDTLTNASRSVGSLSIFPPDAADYFLRRIEENMMMMAASCRKAIDAKREAMAEGRLKDTPTDLAQ